MQKKLAESIELAKIATSDPVKLQVAEVLKHLEIRKRINPLEFFVPFQRQQLFFDCTNKIKGIWGGNRGGKTAAGSYYVIQKCLQKPKQRWWACAETEELSISVQQRKIWEMLPKIQTRYCYYDEVNGFRNSKIIFKNGSNIKFKTYKQGREAFASDDLDGIWNDEELGLEIYREQKMRLLDRAGEMIFTMTSLLGMTDLMQELYEDHDILESKYAPLIDETVPTIVEKNNAKFFMLWTTDNPHISQERLEEDVKLMTKPEIRSRVYGVPSNLSGRIYPTFNRPIHVVKPSIIPDTKVCIWHVLDPHDRKPWAMQWWVVDTMGSAYCVREYPWRKNFNDMEFDDKTYDDYASLIKQIEIELVRTYGRSVSKRIIDPNFGNKTVQLAVRVANQAHTTPIKELRRRGLYYKDGIDPIEAGHLQVRKWIHWEEKDNQIIVQPKLFISEECENTIRHLSRYSRKDIETQDGDVKDKVAPMDKYKDFSDLTRYFCMANPHYIERESSAERITEKVY